MTLSLLCDENIPFPLIRGLKRRGIDVITVHDIGLSSADDKSIINKARELGRTIYTHDTDFLRLHNSGYSHTGIFFHNQLKYSIGEAIQKITMACEIFSQEEMMDNTKFL